MNKLVKKLVTVKNKQGFTLLELTVSLFLLIILTLLLMLVLQTTINTSKRFLDYTNYEYALAHKKILETYNNSAKVNQEYNYILMKSKDDSEDVKINFRGDRVYIDKFKDSNSFSGYILLLKNIKSYAIGVGPEYTDLNIKNTRHLKNLGFLVHPYTVDDENQMRNLNQYGVDGVFTNFADRYKKVSETQQ